MTTFNTNTDLNIRSHTMLKARDLAAAQVGRLSDVISAAMARMRCDPAEALAKAARREAARRAVDTLLR